LPSVFALAGDSTITRFFAMDLESGEMVPRSRGPAAEALAG